MDGLDALRQEADRMGEDAARHAALAAAVEQACDQLRRAGLTPEQEAEALRETARLWAERVTLAPVQRESAA